MSLWRTSERGYESGYFFDVSPFHPRRSRSFLGFCLVGG